MTKAKSLILFIGLFVVAAATMKAQMSFTDRIQAEIEGEGVFEIEQDPRLTDIVNGVVEVPSTLNTTSKVASITTEVKVKQDAEDLTGKTAGLHQKIRGYRVQVYFGGSQRADQAQAQNIGTRVTNLFPELRAYTTFQSPHWRCRVGDFIDYQEASAYLHKIKAKGIAQAMVVKSEVYVTEEQLNQYRSKQ